MKLPKKRQIYIYGGITAALIISLALCIVFFFSCVNPQLLTKRANRLIQNAEYEASTMLHELSFAKNFNEYILLEENEIMYLCYCRDSLIFWSNNQETVPFLLSDLNDLNQPLIELRNGIFYPLIHSKGDSVFIALIPIYYDYPLENIYFEDHFPDFLQLPSKSTMSCSENEFCIYSKDGTFMCSIVFPSKIFFEGWRYSIVLILFLFSYLCTIFCIYQIYLSLSQYVKRKQLFFGIVILLIILFSTCILLFQFPKSVFNHPIFSPHYFAYNQLFSSLGQTLIIAITLPLVCYLIYHFVPFKRSRALWALLAYPFVSGILFYILFRINEIMILNAIVFIDLSFIFKINIYSLIHLFSILCLSLSIFFINMMLIKTFFITSFNRLLLLLGESLIVAIGIILLLNINFFMVILCFLWISIPVLIIFYNKIFLRYLFYNVIVFALLSTTLLEYFANKSEQKNRILLAEAFSEQGRKEELEFFFQDLSDKILEDKDVQGYLRNFNDSMPVEYDQVICNYIADKYLNKTWHEYHAIINICSSSDMFNIDSRKNDQSCFDYFYQKIQESGKPTLSPNLYQFTDKSYSSSYIGIIQPNITDSNVSPPTFFIELSPLQYYSEAEHPEFLSEQSPLKLIDASRYSYAVYDSSGLIYSFGNANFPITLRVIPKWKPDMSYYFYNFKNWNNLRYRMDNDNLLIIGSPKKTITQAFSPFIYLIVSYLLILYSIALFVETNIAIIARSKLRAKLQQAILLVLSLAFIVIGTTVLLFINLLNEQKNEEGLQQKTKSVMNAFNNSDQQTSVLFNNKHNANQLLKELSIVFFSEINLYNMQGELYATSNPLIFEQGYLSSLISYPILSNIIKKKEHSIIQQESIGNKKYLSSYSILYDTDENPNAILNVTYFSHSGQHKHGLEAFISTFINIYIIVFLLFLGILLYLSNQITQPIRLLTKYFGKIRIGKRNEKISWTSSDEFAKMIDEYNRMIDDLEISAQKLAASERESGWRDMAQQVAHEIKNPLTPMKLTVQQLQRTWNKNIEYNQEKIDHFCNTLIQQIDALSDIASEFSHFAKTPTPHFELVDLNQTLAAAIIIFDNSDINFHISGFENLFMNADQHLILRIFNNLIKNAIESFDNQGGDIFITASKNTQSLIITIRDTGHGITPEMLQRIFIPTFTTRSSGMGLGLSMVKTIVEEHNGTISVDSTIGKGSTFTINFKI